MIKKIIFNMFIFLSLLSCYKIQCFASQGVWTYIENIELKPIYQTNTEEIQEEIQIIPSYHEVDITSSHHNGKKTWMPYHLFGKNTNQFKIQTIAETDSVGFRNVDGRYLVAVGTGVKADVGQYIDIVLENDEVIPAIVGDIKDDNDTDALNITTVFSGCVCEFIVDKHSLLDIIKRSGDVSSYKAEWDAPVVSFIVYDDLNILKEKISNENQIS